VDRELLGPDCRPAANVCHAKFVFIAGRTYLIAQESLHLNVFTMSFHIDLAHYFMLPNDCVADRSTLSQAKPSIHIHCYSLRVLGVVLYTSKDNRRQR